MDEGIEVFKKSSKNTETGKVYWRLYWKVDGVTISQGIGAVTEREAARLQRLKAAELTVDPALALPVGSVTVADWFEQHIRDRGARMLPSSAVVVRATKRLFVEWLRKELKCEPLMEQVRKRHGLDFYNYLFTLPSRRTKTGRTGTLNSVNTCNKHARNCRAVFASALEHREETGVKLNPFEQSNIQTGVQETDKDFQEVPEDVFTKILDACASDQLRCLFAICYYGGTRSGEAGRLRWANIHWEQPARFVILPKRRPDGREGVRTTKSRLRVVPIEPPLFKILHRAFLERGATTLGPCEGLPHDRAYKLTKMARQAIEAAGVPFYGDPLHALRAQRENEWQEDPALTDELVHQWIGHSKTVARKHYSKASMKAMSRVAGVDNAEKIRQLEEQLARLKAEQNEDA